MRDMIDVCIALFRLYSPTVNAVCRSVILSFKTENRSLFLYSALPLLFTIYERSDAAVSRRMWPHFQFYLLLFHIQRCVDPACRVSVTNSPPTFQRYGAYLPLYRVTSLFLFPLHLRRCIVVVVVVQWGHQLTGAAMHSL